MARSKRKPALFVLKSKRRKLRFGKKFKPVSISKVAKSVGGSVRKFRLRHLQRAPKSIY